MEQPDEDHMTNIGVKVGRMLPRGTAYLVIAVDADEARQENPLFACCSNVPLNEGRRLARVYLEATVAEARDN